MAGLPDWFPLPGRPELRRIGPGHPWLLAVNCSHVVWTRSHGFPLWALRPDGDLQLVFPRSLLCTLNYSGKLYAYYTIKLGSRIPSSS